MTQYVQLSKDATKVITWFAGPQAITADKPGYAELEDTDPRYVAYQALQASAGLRASAQMALDASDITILRCVENGVTVPSAWQAYRTALRSVVSTGTGTLPTQPAYPAGT